MPPRKSVLKSTSHTKGFSSLAHNRVEIRIEPMMRMPPIVGVPFFAPCNSKSLSTSSLVRIGWPNLSEMSRRIVQFPKMIEIRKAVAGGADRAECDVTKNVQRLEKVAFVARLSRPLAEFVEIVEHQKASMTRSIRAARLPLTRTMSPFWASCLSTTGRLDGIFRRVHFLEPCGAGRF